MVLFVGIVFFISLALIGSLFSLKIHEIETGRIVAMDVRHSLDLKALRLKELLGAARLDLKRVPLLVAYVFHRIAHRTALAFALAARGASRQAHRLADFISHTRNFQPRRTRSEFLRKIGERAEGVDRQFPNA